MKYAAALAALAFLSVPAHAQFTSHKLSEAKPGALRMFVTEAVGAELDSVLTQAEAAIAKPITIEYGSARGDLREKILAGQKFEVAVLLPDVNAEMVKRGKMLRGGFPIARVPAAIGLRGDGRGVDVSTPAGLKAALLKAKSVKYFPTGAVLASIHKIFTSLNVTDKIHDTSKLTAPVPLGPGEYEICIYPITEVLTLKELKNLGPVIPQFQIPAIVEAAIGKDADDVKAARAMIAFMQGPAMAKALIKSGMEAGK
jgi:molybdate transport system substrate-binding protein